MAIDLANVSVTDDDAAGLQSASRIAGRYYVQQDGTSVRLAVAELVLGKPVYHTHLIFTVVDALACASLLQKIAQDVSSVEDVQQQGIGLE